MQKLDAALRQLDAVEQSFRSVDVEADPTRTGEVVVTLAERGSLVRTLLMELELVAIANQCTFTTIRLPSQPQDADGIIREVAEARGQLAHLLVYVEAVRDITVAYAR
jgi:hypothetical protein